MMYSKLMQLFSKQNLLSENKEISTNNHKLTKNQIAVEMGFSDPTIKR